MGNGNGIRTIMRDMMLLPSDKVKIDYLVQRIGSCNIKVAEMERKFTEIGTIIDSLPQNANQADLQTLVSGIKKFINELNIPPTETATSKPTDQTVSDASTTANRIAGTNLFG